MKIIKKLVCLLMLAVLCTSTWCDDTEQDSDYKFVECTFENNSSENVFLYMYLINNPNNCSFNFLVDPVIAPRNDNTKFSIAIDAAPYIQINVYKQSTLDTYSKQELSENNFCDKQYIISMSELEAMNFKIQYAGEVHT